MEGNMMVPGIILFLCLTLLQHSNAAEVYKQQPHAAQVSSNATKAFNATSRALRIPPGYENIAGAGYYRFYNQKRTWGEGLFVCQRDGAHLVVIDSATEAAAVKVLFDRYASLGHSYSWIGIHDILMEGEYLTIFNLPVASSGYTNWMYNHPVNSVNNNCGFMDRNVQIGITTCGSLYAFICEYNP